MERTRRSNDELEPWRRDLRKQIKSWDKLEGNKNRQAREEEQKSSKQKQSPKVSHLYPRLITRNHCIDTYLKSLSTYKQAISISEQQGPALSIYSYFERSTETYVVRSLVFICFLSPLSPFAFSPSLISKDYLRRPFYFIFLLILSLYYCPRTLSLRYINDR